MLVIIPAIKSLVYPAAQLASGLPAGHGLRCGGDTLGGMVFGAEGFASVCAFAWSFLESAVRSREGFFCFRGSVCLFSDRVQSEFRNFASLLESSFTSFIAVSLPKLKVRSALHKSWPNCRTTTLRGSRETRKNGAELISLQAVAACLPLVVVLMTSASIFSLIDQDLSANIVVNFSLRIFHM